MMAFLEAYASGPCDYGHDDFVPLIYALEGLKEWPESLLFPFVCLSFLLSLAVEREDQAP